MNQCTHALIYKKKAKFHPRYIADPQAMHGIPAKHDKISPAGRSSYQGVFLFPWRAQNFRFSEWSHSRDVHCLASLLSGHQLIALQDRRHFRGTITPRLAQLIVVSLKYAQEPAWLGHFK